MASSKKCKAVDIAKVLGDILDDTYYATDDALEAAIEKVGETVAQTVAGAAPSRTGAYKSSIKFGLQEYKKGKKKAYVYAENPKYRLTHLLEFGHASRNGGRVAPSPASGHWQKGQEQAEEEIVKQFKKEAEK